MAGTSRTATVLLQYQTVGGQNVVRDNQAGRGAGVPDALDKGSLGLVTGTELASGAKFDKLAYQREYMRKWRATHPRKRAEKAK